VEYAAAKRKDDVTRIRRNEFEQKDFTGVQHRTGSLAYSNVCAALLT
jgi:hypothetical protein